MSALVGSAAMAKNVLEQWLRFDPGLAELIGASGLGKSAVAESLQDDDLRLIRLQPPLTPDAVLTTLARQMGVTPGEVKATIAQIRQQARTARQGGFHTLIVMDKADQVDDAVLAVLARVAGEAEDGAGLATLLLAQRSLRAQVRSVANPNLQINDISLVGLTDDEADELIQLRINDGPWQGDGAAQLDRKALVAAAKGNPGQLLELLTQARAGLPLTGAKRSKLPNLQRLKRPKPPGSPPAAAAR